MCILAHVYIYIYILVYIFMLEHNFPFFPLEKCPYFQCKLKLEVALPSLLLT